MDMATTSEKQGREFHLSDDAFRFIARFVGDQTGIVLSDAKRDMVYSRLVRRLRELGLDGFDAYCRRLEEDGGEELNNCINAITTNLTAFFRENHHFEHLQHAVLPELVRRRADKRRIRIWSAGCSTGEEPYSIAMVVRGCAHLNNGWDVKILATDLDSNVLDAASRGVYSEERVAGMAPERLKRWFLRGTGGGSQGKVRVRPELQQPITFRRLNLLHPWPHQGPLDVIFCRNVVIYFSKDTQKDLFNRFAEMLPLGGILFIGHSESLFNVCDRFKLIGNTIYQRVK